MDIFYYKLGLIYLLSNDNNILTFEPLFFTWGSVILGNLLHRNCNEKQISTSISRN